MNTTLYIKKVVLEKDGKTLHFSNFYVAVGSMLVAIRPSFTDKSNFALLESIALPIETFGKEPF